MSKESLYFIKIDLPRKENEYLRHTTLKVSRMMGIGEPESDFHLTIERTLYCPRGIVRFDLNKWLEMQNPFEFTLNDIDYFRNRNNGLMYLTTANPNERDYISDLHYGIHEIIKSSDPNKQNNFDYIPHVTLLRGIPLEKVETVRERFFREIDPFKINISKIAIKEKYDSGQWSDFRRFNLGVLN